MPNKLVDGLLVPLTQEEINDRKLQEPISKAQDVRSQRDTLLKEYDWTQIADVPLDQAAWATYRQALRDIPSQAGFPNEVTWPVAP
tara:strand:+ start:391 stop:648 length:258 start_codon:yes stop_codon:yes gene_type:complete